MSLVQEIKKIKSSPKELRQFGLTLGSFFALLGSIALWKQSANAKALLMTAGAFLFFGILWPSVLKPFQKMWMGLALVMGAVMSRVILCALFFLVITPIGLITRLLGKDFLTRSWDPDKGSYWTDRPQTELDPKHYENQF